MSHYTPYPAYKNPGVEWIRELPKHWELSPVRRAFRVQRNTVGEKHKEFRLLSLTTRGIVERDISENFGKFPESFDTYQAVHPGNFVFCLFDIDETPRTVARSDLTGMITGAYTVFDCITPEYSSYILYLFLHLDSCKGLKPFYTGLRKTIRPPKFTSIRIPFPPDSEIRKITRFLDRETTRIDTLIEKKTRFIELLKEKRAAVITHAVTKGIDPDVPMKEGSFKALGSVPAHWELSPVGRAFRLSRRTVGGRHGNFRLLSLTTRGIIERDISENFGKFPESFDTYQEVHPGNFVFCLFDIDETPRTVARSELTGMITGAYTVFDCVAAEYSSYILYLFLHLDEWKALKPFYTGLRKTIRPPKFTSIRIPFPPAEEAMQIAAHIETQTSKIDTLISLTERSIELLKEKRSALITAAVTGKIDVREAA